MVKEGRNFTRREVFTPGDPFGAAFMANRADLLHALFPVVRAEILRLLFTNPGTELYVRQLALLSDLAVATVQVELKLLFAADLIVSRSNGYQRFYRANPAHPLYRPLRKLVVKSSNRRFVRPKRGAKSKRSAQPRRAAPEIRGRLPGPFRRSLPT